MPKISRRAAGIPASPIRRLVPFANEAKGRGVHVHHLNIGQPDIPTPPTMLDAFRKYDEPVLAYGPSVGLPRLRELVAEDFTKHGVEGIGADNVFVTTGGSEALSFAMTAVAEPGDEILVPEPYYANYGGFAAVLGIRLQPLATSADTGFHLPPDDVIEATISPRTKAILLANPGNPTGTVYTPEELDCLAVLAEAHDLFIISDEVYRDFVYDGGKLKSALTLPRAEERVIVTDSISKRFSACGARVGFVVTKNEQLADSFLRMGFARLCPATVAQHVAIAGYELDSAYFAPVIAEYQSRRDLLVEGLRSIAGVHTYKPEGAFYTVVILPVDDSDVFCKWLLTDFSHKDETVMMAPASGFYATPGLGKHEARIAYVLEGGALKRAVDVLGAALDVYPGRARH